VNPTTGVAGTQVTITGTGFGPTQGSGNVWLGSTYGVIASWSDTQVVATIASGAKSGTAQILQSGVWSNAVNLTVITPNITSVTPTTGVAGTQVTITGAGFGAVQGSGNVWLGNTYGVVVSWTDTQVVATIASGAKSGTAQILQGGVWSNAANLTVVTPDITSVTPTSGVAGTQVTITGTGFGAARGNGNVWLGNTYGVVVSWTDTQVVATIALGAKSGTAQILQGGVWSNAVNLTVVTPNITSVTPTTGVAGTQVTITGTGFGAVQGSGNVWLGNAYGVVVNWTDTQVVATIALGAKSGTAQILQGGVWSNAIDLTVITPNITSVTPTSGVAGTPVTITGTGFGTTQGSGNVWLGNTYGVVVSWSDTQVLATIASGAKSGTAQILQGGVWSNAINLTVVTPNITSVMPTSGVAGTQVTITGTGFGATQGNGNVWLGNTYGVVVTWSDTQVVATIASGSKSGTAQILQGGVWSNSVNLTVVTPTITSMTPTTGVAGTQVTIVGTGFGATQGSGNVWLGNTYGVVVSWTDTQVVATVAPGATSGTAQVLQGGVWSDPVNFTVGSQPLGSLNTSRYQHSATLLNNGKILIAGGVSCPTAGSCTYLSSAELYDPVTGTSANTGIMATPQAAPAVLLANGEVLIAGGSRCDPYGNCFSLNSIEVYDPLSGTFGRLGTMHAARDGHTMTLLADGRVLIAGGESCIPSQGGGSYSQNRNEIQVGDAHLIYAAFNPVTGYISCTAQSSAEIYDPQSGASNLTGSLNSARYNAAAVRMADGRILVVGGSSEYSPLYSAEVFDPTTGSFTPTSSGLGTARSSPAATLLGNGLVLISGGSTCEAPTCPTTAAELYDPAVDAFRYTSGNLNSSRVNHAAVLLTNGQVLLAGGTATCPQPDICTSDATTEIYDPAADTFNPSSTLATARSEHTGTLLSNGSVLIAGGIANGTTLSSIELYEPSNLVPAGIQSITVLPTNSSITVGGIQQFAAIGTFADGSTSALPSVAWTSSNTSVSEITNAAGESGFAIGIGLGSTTITAKVGTLSASSTLTVQQPGQSDGFTTVGQQMETTRYGHTATRLTNGQVLIAGGMSTAGVVNNSELYTPASRILVAANSMILARWLHTATLLNDGRVLVVGGSDSASREALDSAELYDPVTTVFTLLSARLHTARVGHVATLLNNGQVLITGGYNSGTGLVADAELYDPLTQTFLDLGNSNTPRYGHTATMLQDGRVLIAGGQTDAIPTAAYNTAEIFDPLTQTFTVLTALMTASREGHEAVRLSDGRVLLAGGSDPATGPLNSAELYDPVLAMFIPVSGTMTTPRTSHAATLLNGDQVLIIGGSSGVNGAALSSAEIFDQNSQLFTSVGYMASGRESQTDTLLDDGTVLIAGGTDGASALRSAELYTASQLTGLTTITISPPNPAIGLGGQQLFTAVGTFADGSVASLASILWSSSNSAVAPVSNDATNSGAATSLTQGAATITASADGVSGSAVLTISAPTLVSIEVDPQDPTIPLGATQQFTATGTYTDGSTQDLTAAVTWSASGSVAATINGSGLAAGVFQGVATIRASLGSLNATTNLIVTSPALVSISVSPASATVPLGGSQQYQAIGTYSDTSTQVITSLVAWSSSAGSVATISGTGLARGLAQGTSTLTATSGSVSATVPLVVGPPSLTSLAIAPSAASLSVGSTQQLTAIGTYTDGSTQNLTAISSWSSSNTAVVLVSGSGLASAASVGEATITATSGSSSATAVLIATSGATPANLNTSRYLHSTTTLNTGQILVAGGINCPSAGPCSYLSSAEIYDPASGAFTNTGSMAQARSAPAVLLSNGNVLIAGGYACDTAGNCSSLSSAEIYNPNLGTFSSTGNLTVARSDHAMTVLRNGTVLIVGGQTCTTATSCTALSTAEIFDPAAGTFTATPGGIGGARFGASAVTLNSGLVLVAGGFDGSNLPAAALVFDPTYSLFTLNGAQLNTPRFGATATLLNNGKVLVVGGSTCALPGCPTNAAEIYDPATTTFSTVSAGMTVARFDHTATLLTNGEVLLAGGLSSCGSSCTTEASTELFDSTTGVFSSGQALGNARAGQTAALMANASVLLIGGINASVTLANDEWYQPTSLTPPGLVSIAVSPAAFFLMPSQLQQLTATGTFEDGSTQNLQSVIWTSSSPSAATVTNSQGNAGVVTAQATGSTTITATAGNVGGLANVRVAGLASIALAPANPTLSTGTSQQITATGTFSDSSTQNVSASATWTSSDNAVVLIGNTPGLKGLAVGASAGTANVTATVGSLSASTSINVQTPVVISPSITSVSPSGGVAGTQVTISGSHFGNMQDSGTVRLGSTYGIVDAWSDTQIVATVAPISTSGTVQVQQAGRFSNSVPFTVNTAMIWYVSPTSGLPGTAVTISGSNFGVVQGDGQVILGSTSAAIQSWSDTQIVAVVSQGSTTGFARVMQDGVMSNAVPFTIDLPQINDINPSSGGPGTPVYINGSGFGAWQGSGTVWLGSAPAEVISWTNTRVMAVVAPNAVTGFARIAQNGASSNAIPFTVPSNGPSVTLVPSMMTMTVGQSRTIQALDSNGQPVSGLTWTSSNPGVVSLSNDDPPILTAMAQGYATIVAGGASATVTVTNNGYLAPGTIRWSYPIPMQKLAPAVPSLTGVADIFGQDVGCNVHAVTIDGYRSWKADIGHWPEYSGNYDTCSHFIPDFKGGIVAKSETRDYDPYNFTYSYTYHIQKLDGITGQSYPQYSLHSNWWLDLSFFGLLNYSWGPSWQETASPMVVHPDDGTIFTLDSIREYDPYFYYGRSVVDVIDPQTGNLKAAVEPDRTVPYQSIGTAAFGDLIVAGDRYAYVPYTFGASNPLGFCSFIGKTYFRLLRIAPNGDSSWIPLGEWDTLGKPDCSTQPAEVINAHVITNRDQGVLISWQLWTGPGYDESSKSNFVTITSGTSVVSKVSTDKFVIPMLQSQDGTFYGSMGTDLVHLGLSGRVEWSVPNDSPRIATPDGGVIGSSGFSYFWFGAISGVAADLPLESWTGWGYIPPLQQVVHRTNAVAIPPYWSFADGNQSRNSVTPLCHDPSPGRDDLVQQYSGGGIHDAYFDPYYRPKYGFDPSVWPSFTPNCFELASASSSAARSANYTFADINNPGPTDYPPDVPAWALIKYPLVVPATAGYGLDKWLEVYQQRYGSSRAISSGYRDPKKNGSVGSSRHLFGDAIDFQSVKKDQAEFDHMNLAANLAGADWVETGPKYPCSKTLHCSHADWRYHDRGKYVH
jgi:hypothetical protein